MATDAKWSDFGSLDAERTLAAASALLPRWIALALVVAIAWQLAKIIWLLMPGADAGADVVVPPAQLSNVSAATTNINMQTVADAHLFGEANPDEVVEAPVVETENLAETRLSLTLKGTIASPDSGSSIAIIADNSNEEKIYLVDDSVIQGATLHAIYPDRVVLNRSGSLEVLKLPKEFPQGRAPVRRNAAVATRATNNSSQSLQNVVAQNVTKLADVIRPTPYYVSGQMQGYRVYPGRDRKQFAALGLRPGDLIKDIDGAALTNPTEATQIFQNLGDKDQVSVTVERNGQAENIILSTSQLELDDSQ